MRKPKHYFLLSVASLILFVNISGLKQKMTPAVYCRRHVYLSQNEGITHPQRSRGWLAVRLSECVT